MKKYFLIIAALLFQSFASQGGPSTSSGRQILFEVRCIDKLNTGLILTLSVCRPTPSPNGISLKTCGASLKENQFTGNYFISPLPQSPLANLVISANNGKFNVMSTEVNSSIKGMRQFVGQMSATGLTVREVPVDCFVK